MVSPRSNSAAISGCSLVTPAGDGDAAVAEGAGPARGDNLAALEVGHRAGGRLLPALQGPHAGHRPRRRPHGAHIPRTTVLYTPPALLSVCCISIPSWKAELSQQGLK